MAKRHGHALLEGVRVLELATGIAGAYCGKLLVDAGAEVVKVEPPDGDPVRRWTASRQDLGTRDGALFQYLNASKRSVVAPGTDGVATIAAGADVLIESGALGVEQIRGLRDRYPHLSIVSITAFGKQSSWRDVPATELTLQALSGSIAGRGDPEREPIQAGGRLGEWVTGSYAAVVAAALVLGVRRGGMGDWADVSMLECMSATMSNHQSIRRRLMPEGSYARLRTRALPSIEPTSDGYVGLSTVTRQQFNDLLVMIDRADLLGDEDLATLVGRNRRRQEFLEILHAWTTRHTTDEVVALAAAFRIPVAPVGRPHTIPHMDQIAARGVFVANGAGAFVQPRVPYLVDGAACDSIGAAPRLGEHGHTWRWTPVRTAAGEDLGGRPMQGVRIVDLTAFWAGPAATQVLAALGADVVKVESIQRPDGMRFTGCRAPSVPEWWEWGYFYQAINANKRGVTLDLTSDRGRDLLLGLVGGADVLIENFTPRVLDGFGLTADVVHGANDRIVFTRMPAFGLDGPWRDRSGFAQTMEQASGMAWLTGYRDGPPVIPQGPCDPLAGMHAAFATICALVERERSGTGHVLECPMIESALNVAAELVIEHSAYGAHLHRDANRGPVAAPQGVYPCAGEDTWIAIAVVDDDQWLALVTLVGDERLARPALAERRARFEDADAIDAALAAFTASRDADDLVGSLHALGIPAAPVVSGAAVDELEVFASTGFVEELDHRVVGRHPVISLPFRLASRREPWITTAAPTLGQHNDEVLRERLGFGDAELEQLRVDGVIGEQPLGA